VQLPVASQQVRGGSVQPHVPSTTAVLSPRTSSQLLGLTQAEPPKIISHGHVPRGNVEMLELLLAEEEMSHLFWVVFCFLDRCCE